MNVGRELVIKYNDKYIKLIEKLDLDSLGVELEKRIETLRRDVFLVSDDDSLKKWCELSIARELLDDIRNVIAFENKNTKEVNKELVKSIVLESLKKHNERLKKEINK